MGWVRFEKKVRLGLKKFSGFGPFLSQLFATLTKSLKKFDEKMTNTAKLRLG